MLSPCHDAKFQHFQSRHYCPTHEITYYVTYDHTRDIFPGRYKNKLCIFSNQLIPKNKDKNLYVLLALLVSTTYINHLCLSLSELHFCQSDPCLNNGVCEEIHNGYRCQCQVGYSGGNCERGQWSGFNEPRKKLFSHLFFFLYYCLRSEHIVQNILLKHLNINRKCTKSLYIFELGTGYQVLTQWLGIQLLKYCTDHC